MRLNRILPGGGRKALIVAFDHGFTVGPIPGTENPLQKVRTFVEAGVDGVLLTPGAFKRYIEPFLKPRAPALLMRLDWTNVWYRPAAVKGEYSSNLAASVEDAVRNGADAVVSYFFSALVIRQSRWRRWLRTRPSTVSATSMASRTWWRAWRGEAT